MKIGSVVVTFNPDYKTLELVKTLSDNTQIQKLIVVDNSEYENEYINKMELLSDVKLIKNGDNLGIAKALNIGMSALSECGCDWALTMDQDSGITNNLISKYVDYLNSNDNGLTSILCTNYVDSATGKLAFPGNQIEEIEECISSGSLINIDIFNKLGNFKENYFIDQVDNEYCYRVVSNGYKIIYIPGLDMNHTMGNISKKNIFNKNFFLYNQNPIRTYYRTRNKIWMMREYKTHNLCMINIKGLIKDLIKIFFEKNRIEKVKLFIKGLYDGIRKEWV